MNTFASRTRWLKNRGFTMAEMLIVLVVVGVVIAVAVPLINNSLDDVDVASAAKEIASALAYAQSSSVKSDFPFRVTIDESENTLVIEQKGDEQALAEAVVAKVAKADAIKIEFVVVAAPSTPGKDYSIDFDTDGRFIGVDISSVSFGGDEWVLFDEYGAPSNGGSVVIEKSGKKAVITVEGDTGTVSVEY